MQRSRKLLALSFIIIGSYPYGSGRVIASPIEGLNAPEIAGPLHPVDRVPAFGKSVQVTSGSIVGSPASVLVDSSGAPQASNDAELIQQRSPNGALKIERYVTEDTEGNLVNHGHYKEFDTSGKVIREGRFSMGRMEGAWMQMLSSESVALITKLPDAGFRAPFKSEANFVAGQLHGDWTISDAKGNPVLLWQFDMGNRQNVSTWFDSRQNVVLEIMYEAGVPHGAATQIVAGQREPKKVVYDRGRIVQTKTHWYEQGKKKRAEEMVLIPVASKVVSHDWWNSSVKSETVADVETVRHGVYSAWHVNGQKGLEGQFVNGQPEGSFEWWYPNGQLQAKGHYQDGKPAGQWRWWHANGMKMMEGTYEKGDQVGDWSQWSDQGSLVLRDDATKFPMIKQDIFFGTEQAEEVPARISEQRPEATRGEVQPAANRRMNARPASYRYR